jgi:ABC-type transport system involved in multi-copper enzyme maturation permease subunit
MFLRQVDIELRKTVKHPALWAGLAALLLLLALFIVVHHAQIKYGFVPADGSLEQDLIAGFALFNWISGFIYAVTASVIAAYDYPERTLQLWLTRGLPRPILLLARLTVILLFGALMIAFTLLATLGLAALSRTLFFGSVDTTHLNTAALLPVLLRTFWSSLPYLALTVLLAVLSRSPIFAAGGMIVYAGVFEKLALSLGDRYPALTRFLPGQLSLILQVHNSALDRTAAQPILDPRWMSEPQAILAIGAIFLVTCGLTFLIFSRQDLGG